MPILDITLLKEFVLPIFLVAFAAWQKVKITKIKKGKDIAEDELNDLKSRAESQKIILDMLQRLEQDYADLFERYLNLKKEMLHEKKENDNGREIENEREIE